MTCARSIAPETPIEDTIVKVYRDPSKLEELREFWSARQTSPAGDMDFFVSIVCSSPEVIRPHVIVLFRDGQPQSLLLGRLERRGIPVRLGYLRISTPKLNILTFDDAGWLRDVSATDSELFVREILRTLRSGEADVGNLNHLDTGHPIYRIARSLPGSLFSDWVPLIQIHWMRQIAKNGSFFDGLSKNQRYNHRRRTRHLLEQFREDVRIECFDGESRIDQLMDHAETVARTSYQRGLGVGFVHDERMRFRLRLAAKQGVLRAHVLYLEGKPAAFWIALLSGGVFYSDLLAFDPAYAKYGPGSYLAVKVIEAVLDDNRGPPTTAVDLAPGEAAWKAHLGNQRRQLASLYIFAPTFTAAACNLMRTLADLADRSTKAILNRAGLLTNVKRRWRRLAADPD